MSENQKAAAEVKFYDERMELLRNAIGEALAKNSDGVHPAKILAIIRDYEAFFKVQAEMLLSRQISMDWERSAQMQQMEAAARAASQQEEGTSGAPV